MERRRVRNFLVDREGNTFSLDGTKVPHVNSCFNGKPAYSRVGNELVHLLVAEAFLGRKKLHYLRDKMVVNHKDGNKQNPKLSNLELVTMQRNALHAYEEGLREDNTPLLSKDLRTGEITRHYSLAACARYFGYNNSFIWLALRPEKRGKVWRKYFLIIPEGEEWPTYNPADIGKTLNGYTKEYFVLNTLTQKEEIHNGLSVLEKRTGWKRDTINMRMLRAKAAGSNYVMVNEYRVMYLDDLSEVNFENVEVIEPDRKRPDLKQGFRKPVPIQIESIRTKDKEILPGGIREFCSKYGCDRDKVMTSIYHNGKYKGFRIVYLK